MAKAKSSRYFFLTPFIKKILILVILLSIIIILSGIVLLFFYLKNSNGLNFDISLPSDIARGKPFDLEANISNFSDLKFKDVSINIRLSSEFLFWDPSGENILTDKIEIIAPGGLLKKRYKIIPVGEINSIGIIDASLIYFNERGSRFEIKKKLEAKLSSSAFALEISAPSKISIGSSFSFTVSYLNNSGYDFSNAALEMYYPDGFEINKTSFPFSRLSKKFDLGPLLSGSGGKILVEGAYNSLDQDYFELPFKLFLVINNKSYEVANYVYKFSFDRSSSYISVKVNNMDNYVAKPSDHIVYEISVQNKEKIAIKNAVVKINLDGFVNWESVKTNGRYNIYEKSVVWDESLNPNLSVLETNVGDVFKIELDLSSSLPSSFYQLSNKNLYVKAEILLLSSFGGENKLISKTFKETKVGSLIVFNARGYKKDPLDKVTNYGPLPLKAKTPSSFVVHWYVSNFGNDLSGVRVKAVLPENVKFVGNAGGNFNTAPHFDSSSREVVWEIGDIYAGSGILTGPLDGYFQVEVIPEEKDVGAFIPILGPSILEGRDNFTKSDVYLTKDAIYSNSLFDIEESLGRVVN